MIQHPTLQLKLKSTQPDIIPETTVVFERNEIDGKLVQDLVEEVMKIHKNDENFEVLEKGPIRLVYAGKILKMSEFISEVFGVEGECSIHMLLSVDLCRKVREKKEAEKEMREMIQNSEPHESHESQLSVDNQVQTEISDQSQNRDSGEISQETSTSEEERRYRETLEKFLATVDTNEERNPMGAYVYRLVQQYEGLQRQRSDSIQTEVPHPQRVERIVEGNNNPILPAFRGFFWTFAKLALLALLITFPSRDMKKLLLMTLGLLIVYLVAISVRSFSLNVNSNQFRPQGLLGHAFHFFYVFVASFHPNFNPVPLPDADNDHED